MNSAHKKTFAFVPTPPTLPGLGLSFDIDSLEAPGATGSYNSNLSSKATTICAALTGAVSSPEQQLQAMELSKEKEEKEEEPQPPVLTAEQCANPGPGGGGYQFGFVHVKAVDDTGHDRMVGFKVRVAYRVGGKAYRGCEQRGSLGRPCICKLTRVG